MTDLELISEIRRADNPKALELLREAVERGRMEGSREMAERLSEENARLRERNEALQESRKRAVEENARLLEALRTVAAMANTCRYCGDWFYTPTNHIPRSGCDRCKSIRLLLPEWREDVR